jgi:hypothetical protein
MYGEIKQRILRSLSLPLLVVGDESRVEKGFDVVWRAMGEAQARLRSGLLMGWEGYRADCVAGFVLATTSCQAHSNKSIPYRQ